MAHAIGCLGSAVATYRAERRAAVQRQARKLRNQDRKAILVKVTHNGGQTFKVYKSRMGHLHHVQAAFLYGHAEVALIR